MYRQFWNLLQIDSEVWDRKCHPPAPPFSSWFLVLSFPHGGSDQWLPEATEPWDTNCDTTQQLADLTMSNMNFRVLLLLTTTTFLFVFLRSIFQHQWKRPPMLRPVMACRWSPIMMVKSVVLEPLKQWNKGSVQLSFHASAAQCCLVLQQPCKC